MAAAHESFEIACSVGRSGATSDSFRQTRVGNPVQHSREAARRSPLHDPGECVSGRAADIPEGGANLRIGRYLPGLVLSRRGGGAGEGPEEPEWLLRHSIRE